MKIGTRFISSVSGILLLSFIGIFIVVIVSVNSLDDKIVAQSKTEYNDEVKKYLKNSVDIVFGLVESKYKNINNKNNKAILEEIKKDIKVMRYDNGIGYFWINDTTRPYPVMIMHPVTPALEGKIMDDPNYNCAYGTNENLFKAFVDVSLKNGEGFVDYQWPKPLKNGLTEKTPKISYVKLFKPLNWIIGTGVYVDDINRIIANKEAIMDKSVKGFILLFIVSVLVAMAITFVVVKIITRYVVKPIDNIKYIMKDIAEKDGDLTKRIEVTTKDEVGELAMWFNMFVDKIESVLVKMIEGTKMMANASAQIAEGNQNLSSRTERQAASLEETASSMEEMSAAIKQNAGNAINANKMAQESKEDTMNGVNIVNTSISQMEEINTASKKIADITKLIEKIAFQTNILALNAAVEAARAGEQGRGFAVVASEVRNLAQSTASSIKEINNLINDSVEKTAKGTSDVKQSGEILNEINQKIINLADIMNEISVASVQQQNGVEQVNKAVIDMDNITQQNAALVEEIASSSEELSTQAAELVSIASYFKVRNTV